MATNSHNIQRTTKPNTQHISSEVLNLQVLVKLQISAGSYNPNSEFKFVAQSTSFLLAKAGRAELTATVFSVPGIMKNLGL
jgi:hypothetical protein